MTSGLNTPDWRRCQGATASREAAPRPTQGPNSRRPIRNTTNSEAVPSRVWMIREYRTAIRVR